MKRRLEHAIPLRTNTSSQRRLGVLLQKTVASFNSLRQIPGILETKNLRRQSNIEMTKVITANINRAPNRTLVNNLPIRRQHINNSHNHSHIKRQTEPIVPTQKQSPNQGAPNTDKRQLLNYLSPVTLRRKTKEAPSPGAVSSARLLAKPGERRGNSVGGRGFRRDKFIDAYALLTEPNSSMSSLVRATMASRPGLRSLRGSKPLPC